MVKTTSPIVLLAFIASSSSAFVIVLNMWHLAANSLPSAVTISQIKLSKDPLSFFLLRSETCRFWPGFVCVFVWRSGDHSREAESKMPVLWGCVCHQGASSEAQAVEPPRKGHHGDQVRGHLGHQIRYQVRTQTAEKPHEGKCQEKVWKLSILFLTIFPLIGIFFGVMSFWSRFEFEFEFVARNKNHFRTWLVFHTAIIRFQMKSYCVTIVLLLCGLTLIACVPCAPSQARGEQPSITRIFQGEEDPWCVSALTEWGVRPPKAGQEMAAGDVLRRWEQWQRGEQFTPTLRWGGPWENEAQ